MKANDGEWRLPSSVSHWFNSLPASKRTRTVLATAVIVLAQLMTGARPIPGPTCFPFHWLPPAISACREPELPWDSRLRVLAHGLCCAGFSSRLLVNLPVACVLVLAARWASRRVDITWEGQRLSFSMRDESPTAFRAAHARPRPLPASPQPVSVPLRKLGADVKSIDWQRSVDAPEAAAEFSALADLIVRDVRTL